MPTFDSKIMTQTRVRLGGDSFQPQMGALAGSGFKEDALNHGTMNQVVTADVTRTFLANETRATTANQTETITGARTFSLTGSETETVVGGRTTTVIGMLTETLTAGQMTSCVGAYNRTDVAPVTWLCPTSSQVNSGDLYECKWFKGGAYAFRNNNIGADISLRGSNMQFGLHQMNMTQFETKTAGIQGFTALTTNNAMGLTNFLDAMENHACGMIGTLKALKAGVGAQASPPLDIGTAPWT